MPSKIHSSLSLCRRNVGPQAFNNASILIQIRPEPSGRIDVGVAEHERVVERTPVVVFRCHVAKGLRRTREYLERYPFSAAVSVKDVNSLHVPLFYRTGKRGDVRQHSE